MFFSSLPPISYSIGSWEPQKQFWMFSVILHLPARALLTIVSLMLEFLIEFSRWRWYRKCGGRRSGVWLALPQRVLRCSDSFASRCSTWIPSRAFVSYSGKDQRSNCIADVHAAFFTLWVAATIWGMSIIVHMQRVTGQIYHDRKVNCWPLFCSEHENFRRFLRGSSRCWSWQRSLLLHVQCLLHIRYRRSTVPLLVSSTAFQFLNSDLNLLHYFKFRIFQHNCSHLHSQSNSSIYCVLHRWIFDHRAKRLLLGGRPHRVQQTLRRSADCAGAIDGKGQ